jgi:hypothetical protein
MKTIFSNVSFIKIKYLAVAFLILGSLFVGTGLFANTILADEDVDHLPPGVTHQSDADALAADIALIAEQKGLPLKKVESVIAFQQAFEKYADELIVRYPNQVSAVWVDPVPNMRGHIRFTGEVPSEVAREVQQRGQLDTIALTGNGMITIADHISRAELAAEALVDLGYKNAITFFDFKNNVLRTELKLPEGVAPLNKLDLVNALRNRVQGSRLQGRAAMVDARDINLTILTGSGPIITLQHSRGGNWLRDDGVRECTSGWSVFGPNGDGIITAGHCTGLNQFEEPGVTPYGMSFQSEHRGSGGDLEYHTTIHDEYDDFYATASDIRDVTHIRATNTMVGNSVCVYGRSSNSRSCLHVVEAVGVTIVDPNGISLGSQARTDNATSVAGDSGGGWSLNTTAWGVLTGIGGGKSYFTTIVEAENALGVTVKR